MDISVTVCLCVCTVMDFSAEDKASGVKLCTAVHRRPRQAILHFCELCSPEAQNRTNWPARGPRPPLQYIVQSRIMNRHVWI